jgi:hypothetical protein
LGRDLQPGDEAPHAAPRLSVRPQRRLLVDPQNLRSRRAVAKIGGVAIGSRLDADGRTSIAYQIEASAFDGLI